MFGTGLTRSSNVRGCRVFASQSPGFRPRDSPSSCGVRGRRNGNGRRRRARDPTPGRARSADGSEHTRRVRSRLVVPTTSEAAGERAHSRGLSSSVCAASSRRAAFPLRTASLAAAYDLLPLALGVCIWVGSLEATVAAACLPADHSLDTRQLVAALRAVRQARCPRPAALRRCLLENPLAVRCVVRAGSSPLGVGVLRVAAAVAERVEVLL